MLLIIIIIIITRICAAETCTPQCVPKSTSVTLAVDEKTLPMPTITGRTDRRTDRQTDGQTECDAICGPLLGRMAA